MRKLILVAIFVVSGLGAWGERLGLGVSGDALLGGSGGGLGVGASYLFANNPRVGHEISVGFFHQEVHEFPIYIDENDYLVFYNLILGYSPETEAGFFWFLGGGAWIANSLSGGQAWTVDGAADLGCGWIYGRAWELRFAVPVVFATASDKLDVGGGLMVSVGYRL